MMFQVYIRKRRGHSYALNPRGGPRKRNPCQRNKNAATPKR